MKDFLFVRATVKPVVMTYSIKSPATWRDFRHKIFYTDNAEWKRYVWNWRQAEVAPEHYDWAFGPVADGGIYLPDHNSIKAFPNQNQMSIHNERTAQFLQLLEVESC